MSPDRVADAVGGAVAERSRGGVWEEYGETGVTALYGPGPRPGLVTVAVAAQGGPPVRLGGVELVGRVPSEVYADLHGLARREAVTVRVSRGGDPRATVWGLSLGAGQEWEVMPGGYRQRTDRVLTNALFTAPGLAADPCGAEPVRRWRQDRRPEPDTGAG
ncbi:hypothetical protein [Streptomyces clavuligerus]|nr:hypothetical protein [Streptomyces clavuligerus]WDN56463.1 hypothetical protein LL058_31995 [Streptomyces clavuligerus]